MKQSCNKNYPRLSELARECGECNYFSKLLNKTHSAEEMQFIKETEEQLCRLDKRAWEAFKSKVKNYATKPQENKIKNYPTGIDKLLRYSQVIDVLNEAKGYIFLKDQGYENVEFIPEGSVKEPDLYAYGEEGKAYMDVKTIHTSDEERRHLLDLEAPAMDVIQAIPGGLKNKLKDAVEKAKEQLSDKVGRKICYLCIDLDFTVALNSRNDNELDRYLDKLRKENSEVEIVRDKK